MLKALKNAFGWGASNSSENSVAASQSLLSAQSATLSPSQYAQLNSHSASAQWAREQGLAVGVRSGGKGLVFDGQTAGKDWRIELGRPSRDFIHDCELRARAEMGASEDAAVLILNRTLKIELEKRAFSLYTDSLQTQVDPSLPEEMRWLSMYEEVGWESLGMPFFEHYAILADKRENASAWVTDDLAKRLMEWIDFDASSAKILMLLRGKVYLRMQIDPDNVSACAHAHQVFTLACQTALAGLPGQG